MSPTKTKRRPRWVPTELGSVQVGDMVRAQSGESRRVTRIECHGDDVVLIDDDDCLIGNRMFEVDVLQSRRTS